MTYEKMQKRETKLKIKKLFIDGQLKKKKKFYLLATFERDALKSNLLDTLPADRRIKNISSSNATL